MRGGLRRLLHQSGHRRSSLKFTVSWAHFLALDAGSEVSETLSDDIQRTIHSILRDAVNEIGAELPIMSKDDKIDLIARLDEKGAFQVKRAVPLIAEELGLSRSTIYNYLAEAREKTDTNAQNGA